MRNQISIVNDISEIKRVNEYLSQFITENKRNLFAKVLEERTRYIAIALEDIYQPHNASATVRTCDCFGIQDLYIIENRNRYTINPDVTLGSSKWVDLIRYNKLDEDNTIPCLEDLKRKGYRLVATTPHRLSHTPDDLPLDQPIALLFGTEETGLTENALKLADESVQIQMFGFTESFNISVSVAILLNRLSSRLRNSKVDWGLSEDEKIQIEYKWLKKVIRRSSLLEKEFLKPGK